MAHQVLQFLCIWLICGRMIMLCKGHPRHIDDYHRNHTADALSRLLKVFGVEKTVPNSRRLPRPPQYMLDLYRLFEEAPTGDRHHHGANTVRSFFEKGSSTNDGHYQFELSTGIPDHEEVVEAQFHFFTNHIIPASHQSPHVIQIRLYDGLLNSSSKLLEARLVSVHSSGWEVFRVTQNIKHWLQNEESNKGFTVQLIDVSGREWRNQRFDRLQSRRRPILVVFSQDSKTAAHRRYSKLTDRQDNRLHPALTNQNMHILPTVEGGARNARSTFGSGECTRHELRVDFEKLGWSTWIISPKWYDAYVCAGTCAFPLGQNQRPSNHATVQSIVHELGLASGVGAPSCVPTELHSVSLLYIDEHNNVVLKQYDDMVAAGCGCQ